MYKVNKRILAIILMLTILATSISTGASITAQASITKKELSKMYLNTSVKYLHVKGETKNNYTFKVKKGAKHTWYVKTDKGNPDSVVVNKKTGLVTAKNAGTAYVRCKVTLADGSILRPEAKVVVRNNIKEVEIKNIPKDSTIIAGKEYNFDRTILNTDAGKGKKTQGKTRWEIKDDTTGVGTATDKGVVLPMEAGTFKIRAVSFQSNAKYKKWLTNKNKYKEYITAKSDWATISVDKIIDEEIVTPTPEPTIPVIPEIPIPSVKVSAININKSTTTLVEGTTETLTVTFTPSNASNKTITWTTSDASKATIDSTGKVRAVSAGTATITAKSNNGKTATCVVTVTTTVVPVSAITVTSQGDVTTVVNGKTLQMGVVVGPEDATNKKVTWSVTNGTGTATISTNGLLTATGVGTVTVKALAQDGSGEFGTKEITIIADTIPPIITLLGASTMNLTVGDTFTDPGATALDDVDGDITSAIVVAGDSVDTSTAGTYVITYNVSDAAGNAATEVTRTVVVAKPEYASTNALANDTVTVANGTSEADAIAALDSTVGIKGTKGETGTANIAWTIASYVGSTDGNYTATGVLTLPTGWTGSAADVTATVKVTAAPVITGVTIKTPPTKVTYTEGENLGLAGLVVTLAKSDSSTEDVAFADFGAKGITTVKADGDTLNITDTEVVINVNGKTVNQAITVNPATVAVTGVILDQATLNLVVGGATGTLTATVNPTDATNKNVTWTSSNETTATVANGIVTPLAAGSTTITVTTDDGSKIATCVVTVAAESFTLTYTAGTGGTITGTSPQTVSSGGDGTTVTAIANEGYSFDKWSDGVTTAERTDKNVTANITVEAQFKINEYTVTFKDHDDLVLKTETVEHGSDAAAPTEPTRTGYTFTGWDKGFDNVTSDLTVKAQYNINKYTITFDSDGGSTVASITQDYGTAITPPANPTKTGYTFANWNPSLPANMPANDLTVIAQYTKDALVLTAPTVTSDLQEGKTNVAVGAEIIASLTATGGDSSYTYSLEGTDAAKFAIDSSTGKVTVKDNPLTEGTYNITVKVTDGVSATAKQAVSVLVAGPDVVLGAPVTGLEAVLQMGATETATASTTEAGAGGWTSSDPSVATVDASTGVVTALKAGTTTIAYTTSTSGNVNSKEITVYASTFTSQTDNSISNDVATLGLVGNEVSSSSSFVATGAIESDKIKITSSAQGSTIIIVKSVENFEAKIAVTVAVDGTITIGAITKPALNVTYDINGGSGTVPTQAPLTSGDTFTVASPAGLTAPTGKQFKEWNTSHYGIGTGYAPGSTFTMGTSHVTLYAIWENIYTVTFVAGANGSLTGTTEFANITNGTAWETAVTVPSPVADSGFKFKDWTPTFPATVTKKATYTANFVAVDNTALTTAITDANTNKVTAVVSTDGFDIDPANKWVTSAEMVAYELAISTAQGVADNTSATQTEVDDAVTALGTATTTFNDAKKDGIQSPLESFDPVTLSQTGDVAHSNVQYTDAAAVIAELPTEIAVTLENSSVVNVPVTWADTDTYNAGTAADYTFTATWGTMPAGANNDNSLAAPTVEVTVEDRAKITNVEATSTIEAPVYGETIVNPTFTITEGSPAHFNSSQSWQKKNGDKWESVYSGNFTEGTWRFRCQVRIDGEVFDGNNGTTHKLASPLKVMVGGDVWLENGTPSIGDTYSYDWVISPVYEVTAPVGTELTFNMPSYSVPLTTVNNAIAPYSVASFAEGGTKPYKFSKTSGPEWINVSEAGEISGMPVTAGTNSDLIIRVTDNADAHKEITINVAKTVINPSERTDVNNVVATSSITAPIYGATIEKPTFEITEESPAYFNVNYGNGWWEKKNGDNWDTKQSGEFTEGTWRFRCQVRIDDKVFGGKDGTTHKLASPLTVTVNDKKWLEDGTPSIQDTYSYNWVNSPEYEVTNP